MIYFLTTIAPLVESQDMPHINCIKYFVAIATELTLKLSLPPKF